MKKCRLLTVGVLLLSLLLSGCNSETDPELEEIIGNLPAAQVSDGKISFDPPVSEEENNTQYSSLTGNIVSASAKEITVKYNDSEYKFTIDGDTKIYGGEIKALNSVTITYEGELSNNKKIAGIITVLTENGSYDTDITSEEPPVTAVSEAVTEPIETSATQTTAAEEIPEETSTEAVTVQSETTSAAEETTTVSESNSATEAETEAITQEEITAVQ